MLKRFVRPPRLARPARLARPGRLRLATRETWTVLGLLLLLVLLWLVGLVWHWPMWVMLAGTIVILFGAVLFLLFQQHQQSRDAGLLEHSLHSQAQEQLLSVRP